MKGRTLFWVGVLVSLTTAALLYVAPAVKREAATWWCSYRPIPNAPAGSKIAVAAFLGNATEGERSQFVDSRAGQFRIDGPAVIDFVQACARPDEAKATKWLRQQNSAQAIVYAEASGPPQNRRVRLNIVFKDGSKSAPPAPFDVDGSFGAPALDEYLAEALLLKPYAGQREAWEEKLQNTIENKIENSAASDRLAEKIAQVADNPLLQGNCDAQLLAADAYIFGRRPEKARKRMNSLVTIPACARSKYSAGLIYRLATIEIESARETGSSSAQRAFRDDAYALLEKLWALPEELREDFSGVAIATMWKFRPASGLTTADLRRLKDRSAEAARSMKGKTDLYVSLRQQEDSISPVLHQTESEELAAAEKIRADAEAQQAREKEKEETARAGGAADAREVALQLAAEQKARTDQDIAGLKDEVSSIKRELQTEKEESAKLETERDEVRAELYRRIKTDEKSLEEKNRTKPRRARSERRPACVVTQRKSTFYVQKCRTASR